MLCLRAAWYEALLIKYFAISLESKDKNLRWQYSVAFFIYCPTAAREVMNTYFHLPSTLILRCPCVADRM